MYPQAPAEPSRLYDRELTRFLDDEQLPEHYAEDARRFFIPLIEPLIAAQQSKAASLFVGINGAQGSGKSTLAALLTRLLACRGFTVANLSIDDFYLSRSARQHLARTTHPLLASRGVPGTHDTVLLDSKLNELRAARAGSTVSLPRFDKAVDDCLSEQQWPVIEGPVHFIVLEGWFVGLGPEPQAALKQAVNDLEAQEDSDGRWRHTVNQALAKDYQSVFKQIDLLAMIRAPSFDQVYQWRSLQEAKLRSRSAADAAGLMDDAQLRRFIQHFERLTRHCLTSLPEQADLVFELDADHRIVSKA